MSEKFRLEHDSVGELEVPADAYYGVQTLRGARNFRITGKGLHPLFISNMAKIKKACALLESSNYSVKTVAYSTGFSDQLYFSKVFKKLVGMTPTEYRKR